MAENTGWTDFLFYEYRSDLLPSAKPESPSPQRVFDHQDFR